MVISQGRHIPSAPTVPTLHTYYSISHAHPGLSTCTTVSRDIFSPGHGVSHKCSRSHAGGRAGQNMTSFILSIHTHNLRGARHWSNPKDSRSRGTESLPQAQQDPVFHAGHKQDGRGRGGLRPQIHQRTRRSGRAERRPSLPPGQRKGLYVPT